MSELSIQYQGFHPSAFTKEYLDSKLNHLLDQSPYGASMKAVFQRDNECITATLRIMSSAGEFFAIAKGRRLKDVNRRIMNQVRRQLQRWKERRYGGSSHDSIVA